MNRGIELVTHTRKWWVVVAVVAVVLLIEIIVSKISKFSLGETMKALRRSRGIALLFL